ncbi:hypothetical protein Ancab_028271 [Ancistrocladus abbreviatus]
MGRLSISWEPTIPGRMFSEALLGLGEMGRGLSSHCRCSNANALSRLCSYPEFDPLPFTVFRNQDKPKRLQIVVSPNGSAIDFVGTNYSGKMEYSPLLA